MAVVPLFRRISKSDGVEYKDFQIHCVIRFGL